MQRKELSIIKNPARKIEKKINKTDLEPQYKSLGINPQELIQKPLKEDFRYAAEKRIEEQKKEIYFTPPNQVKTKFPPQMNVGNISGFANEATWRPSDNNDDPIYESSWKNEKVQPIEELEQEEEKLKTEEFTYETIKELEEADLEEDLLEKEEEKQKYVVVYNQKIIFSHNEINRVELFLEEILFNENNEYKNITVDELLIFKRLSLKAGVIIRE